MNETERSLLDEVLGSPNSDEPRLVYADWIEEYKGEVEIADYIRCSIGLLNCMVPTRFPNGTNKFKVHMPHACDHCIGMKERLRDISIDVCGKIIGHAEYSYQGPPGREILVLKNGVTYTFSRGWPSAVALTMSAFMGERCERCEPDTRELYGSRMAVQRFGRAYALDVCPDCKGSGHVPGLIEKMGRMWPITSVTLTDREPYQDRMPGEFYWVYLDDYEQANYSLPGEIWRRLANGRPGRMVANTFPTRAAAMTALSDACVSLLRERACLPPLYTAASSRADSAIGVR